MQSYAALLDDIEAVRERVKCGSVSIVQSHEPWNPVAAVVLGDLELPPAIRPRSVDLRILIPNLYGFAVSVGVATMPVQLMEETQGRRRSVPYCVPTEQSTLEAQMPYYADVRENHELLRNTYSICVTPTSIPDRFRHLPLHEMVGHLLGYLEAPHQAVADELVGYYSKLEREGPSVFLFLCIAHAHAGLQEYDTALAVLDRGQALYPEDSWLKRKAAQIRSLVQ